MDLEPLEKHQSNLEQKLAAHKADKKSYLRQGIFVSIIWVGFGVFIIVSGRSDLWLINILVSILLGNTWANYSIAKSEVWLYEALIRDSNEFKKYLEGRYERNKSNRD